MHHGIATAIASDFWIADEIARNFRSEKQIWPFFIAKCIATATVSLPQRNRNLFPRKNRFTQFDRINESQTSTANHRRETVHLDFDPNGSSRKAPLRCEPLSMLQFPRSYPISTSLHDFARLSITSKNKAEVRTPKLCNWNVSFQKH